MQTSSITSIDAAAAAAQRPRTPAELKLSLAGLENEDLEDRVDRLIGVLAEVRHDHLSLADRYEVLRHCLASAGQVRAGLTKRLVGLSLPPPPDQISLSRRCAEAYRLMSYCFRGIAEDISRQDTGPVSDANRLSHCCFWAINCLGDYIVIRCECYLKASTGIWLDLHGIYDLAVAEGVEQLPLGKKPKQVRTVDSAYKRLLLLGLSDPFQHPFRGLRHLYEKLNDWASLTYLTKAMKPASRCVLVVDPRLDRPAGPALSQADLRSELDQKWFVTRDLVSRLKREYDTVISQSADHVHRHRFSTDELGSIDFLRRMIVRWGIHPVRISSRRKTFKSCDLVAGLRSVCLALNDFKPLKPGDIESGMGIRSMIKGTYGHDEKLPASESHVRDGWEVEDESENGLKLVCRPSGNCGVGVDDLVAVRTGHTRDWSIGTVHWAQTDESGNVALGVRLIALPVRPVLVDRLHAGSERVRSEALLLVDRSDGGLNRSLICPTPVYYPTGTYLVRLPGQRAEFVVEATNILLSSRSFVWFEAIKPQGDTAQKVLDLIHPR